CGSPHGKRRRRYQKVGCSFCDLPEFLKKECGKSGHRSRHLGAETERIQLAELDVEAEGLDFLDQHVEGFRRAGLQRVVALDERLVDLGTTLDVVGLDGEELLEG